jgi:hypothetical protein
LGKGKKPRLTGWPPAEFEFMLESEKRKRKKK